MRGAIVQRKERRGTAEEVRARYVVVADGANSRFGRALGTSRDREWPYGTAIRGYWASPLHDEPWIESALDVKDRNGNPMPGYGWIFPVGDGTREHRRRPAVDVPRLQGREHHQPPPRVRGHRARLLGPRTPTSPRAGRRAGACRWVARSARRSARRTSSSVTPPAPSTRSTARASTTPTRPGAWPPRCSHEAIVEQRPVRPPAVRQAPRRRVRPVLQGGPAVRPRHRPARAHAGADATSACRAARSWSGCCGSWPTCCGPTSWARPKRPTRPPAALARLAPEN